MTEKRGRYQFVELYDYLFDILCCMMASDGHLSQVEAQTILSTMRSVGVPWSDAELLDRLKRFVERAKKERFKNVVEDALTKVPLFKQYGEKDVVIEAISKLNLADGVTDRQEAKLFGRILKLLDAEAPPVLPPSAPPPAPAKRAAPTALPSLAASSPAFARQPELYDYLLDLLCCVIAADGHLAQAEGERLREIMHSVGASWSDQEFYARFGNFVVRAKKDANQVIADSMAKVPLFKKTGTHEVLSRCISLVVSADGVHDQREVAVYDQILKLLA